VHSQLETSSALLSEPPPNRPTHYIGSFGAELPAMSGRGGWNRGGSGRGGGGRGGPPGGGGGRGGHIGERLTFALLSLVVRASCLACLAACPLPSPLRAAGGAVWHRNPDQNRMHARG
jgi:hypothetical protein